MESKTLPIFQFKSEIVKAIKDNPVTVITAETGAGKSTQVPQYLLEKGYDLVVTQPRRLAARTVAQRVAEEYGEKLGGVVGYRTAVDRQDSPLTRCLFCTDGLALVRELMGQNKGILVLDEVHEWNENMEVLVAWAKRQIKAGVDFKVVVMSATMESEKLSVYFDNAPVISVPGRLYPVEVKTAGNSLEADVASLVSEGRNVLVFQPGKQEISDTVDALVAKQIGAEILQLHGELTPEEQARCFRHYSRPKVVVSTNVAQTSVTIDDIDAVVDGGMERRIELVDGVEGLYLKPISRADATQRKGRAGRTKAGIYIDHCKSGSRPDFPVAEIMRKRLDQTVLRLAIAGFDMAEMEFFHQPPKSEIASAKSALISLGCMTAAGEVTRIGKLVNRLPVSVQYARMLIEADRLGVVDDVLTVAAILEQSGITVPPPSRNKPDRPDWRRMVPDEHESDVMGQLAVYEMANSMTKGEMFEKGVALKSYYRAKEVRKHLADALRQHFRFGSTGKREDILKSVCAGMVDHLYQGTYSSYQNGDGVDRELGTASLVRGAGWLVGKPFDLEIKTRRGTMMLHLIELASKVDPMWLTEVAPQLVQIEEGISPYFDGEQDTCFSTTKTHFNGQVVREEKVATPDHPQSSEVFLSAFVSRRVVGTEEIFDKNNEIRKEAEKLWIRSGGTVRNITEADERALYEAELKGKGIVSVQTFMDAVQNSTVNVQNLLLKLEDFVSAEEQARILAENPDTVEVEGEVLAIEYGKEYYAGFYAKTDVDEKFVRQTQAEAVLLPSGRTVEIRCSGHSAKTFVELVEKLEKSRIDRCWSEARSQHETSWTSDSQKVIGWLDQVGESIKITHTENGQGESICGFVGLKQYSGYSQPQWQFFLAETKEKADEETRKSLEALVKTAIKDLLVVPKEDPWQKSGYWNWELTDLGRALQGRFEKLVKEYAEGLTSSNIEEKISALKSAIDAVKAEIGGEHESTKKLIEEADSDLESKIKSLQDCEFVKSEVEEVRRLILDAKTALISGSYADAKAKCEKIKAVWQQAQDRIAQRQDRVEKGEILINFEAWHRRGGMSGNGDGWVIRPDGSLRDHDSNDIRRHNYCWNYVSEDELALKWSCGTMRDIAGSSEFIVVKMPVNGLTEAQREAVRRIELEDIGTTENSFGLDPEAAERQAKVIAEAAKAFASCPACGEAIVIDKSSYRSLTGEYGMHICQDDRKVSRLVNYSKPFSQSTEGRDAQIVASKRVSNGVIEALAYEKWGGWNLNLRWRKLTEEEATEPEPVEEVIQGTGVFAEAGGRHFRCPQGHTLRVTKSEWKAYEAGEAVSVACSVCGASGTVQKTIEAKAKAEAGNGGLDLSQLKAVWGSR